MTEEIAAWCEVEFALSVKQSDDSTLRDHLLTVAGATGERHPWLDRPVPTALLYLYEAFAEMNASREPGLSSLRPISEAQMYYWQRLHNFPLHHWELLALQRIDVAYRRVHTDGYTGPEEDADDGD